MAKKTGLGKGLGALFNDNFIEEEEESKVDIKEGEEVVHKVKIIEIGGRMGGDFIGSDLVRLSTGVDFTQAVINVALRKKPDLSPQSHYAYAAVRFILDDNDKNALDMILKYDSQLIEDYKVDNDLSADVSDSSSRHGYFLFHASDLDTALKYLPKGRGDE